MDNGKAVGPNKDPLWYGQILKINIGWLTKFFQEIMSTEMLESGEEAL